MDRLQSEHSPSHDRIKFDAAPQVPLWTEFLYFYGYDSERRIGVSMHIGRQQQDLACWQATIAVFLCEETLLVAKLCGRDDSQLSLRFGGLTISCIQPEAQWIVDYEGFAQRVTRAHNVSSGHVDAEVEPLRFRVVFQGAAPFWDLRSSIGDHESYARHHIEQICRVNGQFHFENKHVPFRGVGVRDHSCGPRDYSQVLGTFWISAQFVDGRALMAQVVNMKAGETNTGYVYWGKDSLLTPVRVVDSPLLLPVTATSQCVPYDLLAEPSLREFVVQLDTERGMQRLEVELLHSCTATYLPPSTEVLGTDFSRGDGLQWTESVARFRWDGCEGFGVRERVTPISSLCHPR